MHVQQRALKQAGLDAKKIQKLFGDHVPRPYEVIIHEDKYAGSSFISVEEYLQEIKEKMPESHVYIKTCHVWDELIHRESHKDYYKDLVNFLKEQKGQGDIYPAPPETFQAFKLTPYYQTRVVIVGQDPYHTPNTAHGLAFSSRSKNTPPSLHNIYKEIYSDLQLGSNGDQFSEMFNTNDLSNWARQGVLLLNRVLTVKKEEADSHKGKGWETFTEEAIKKLNESPNPLVFMLWGKKAGELQQFINGRHLVLTTSHPSPYSAANGFIGCKHFSQANKFLMRHYSKIIAWANYKEMLQYQ